jgi:large subunit ribosomal protein L18e
MIIQKTNPKLTGLIKSLKENSYQKEAPIWKDVSRRLERSTRRQAEVNLSQLNRYTSVDELVLVPGKILGSGVLDHKIQVAALSFSSLAREKIETAGGECLTIIQLMESNPKGSGVRIIE